MTETFGEKLDLISILRGYLSMGIDSPQKIKAYLESKHGICLSSETVRNHINKINAGEYDNFLDRLLDVHFPDLFQETLRLLHTDLTEIESIAQNAEDPRIQLMARRAHARIAIDTLNTLHKGQVVRSMKQLSSKTKQIARSLIQAETVLRERSTKNQMETNRELYPEIITLDKDLRRVQEETEKIINDIKDDNSNTESGNII